MITIFAAFLALVAGHQQNPQGSPSLPTQIAVYNTSGSIGAIVMEVRDNTGRQVVWKDTNGAIYPSATLSVSSHVALGLGWQATNTMPDSVHPLVSIANGPQYTAILFVSSGTFTMNSAGTYDATVGSGNGIAVGVAAPSASSPVTLVSGSTYVVSAGGQVTPIGSAPVTVSGSVSAITRGSLSDSSGTITTGGTAQTVFASNASRNYLLIVNNSSTDILWISFTTTAVQGRPSIPIYPAGGSFLMSTTYISTEAVSIIGATTGDSYTAKQG